jgi:hypothetical protein
MPVFAVLAGGKVSLYRPLQLLQQAVKYFTTRWSKFQSKSQAAKLGKMSKGTKLHIFWLKKSSINSNFYAKSVFDVNYYILLVSQKVIRLPSP